ncbi:DUF956 family protein [Bombilactobacillus thymidiniphilus]|uniref:DUF956 family protein n=1 Tax=Bombilactobacillus thymidiniphilus TaxID=2923363 RepID=A0ABY4PEH9_9LACO|nr:DUF956 family protein [Bombilactobacillus thymidiniphilus]UQS83916.1 DUF956 family protein [Bombilactobacillus thymidiniphilus]
MVQSLNTKVDLVQKATSHMGMEAYGQIMIGDRGFEFYDDRNIKNYIQIPWRQVRYVIVSVMFHGKWIPRFAVQTKRNGLYTFSVRDPKKVLRAIRKYIDADHIVKSLTFMQVIHRSIVNLGNRLFKKNG